MFPGALAGRLAEFGEAWEVSPFKTRKKLAHLNGIG